jgi:hypothetical protein
MELAGAARDSRLHQATGNFSHAEPLAPDPVEHLPDHPCLLQYDFVASLPTTSSFGHIAVAVGGLPEHTDRACQGCVALASPSAFEDLGPLVLGHHTLYLHQQLILGCLSEAVVEKDDLNTSPLELI